MRVPTILRYTVTLHAQSLPITVKEIVREIPYVTDVKNAHLLEIEFVLNNGTISPAQFVADIATIARCNERINMIQARAGKVRDND